jgi:hypothetical protein
MDAVLVTRSTRLAACAGIFLFAGACASEGSNDDSGEGGSVLPPPIGAPSGGSTALSPGGAAGSRALPSSSPGAAAGSAAEPAGGGPEPTPMGGAGTGAALPMAGMNGAMGGAAGAQASPPSPLTPSGPEDGDPGGAVIAAAGVPCGPNPSLFGLTNTNVMIGGRGVHVAYPCNKRKGGPAIFVLQLHGTMPDETIKLYQVAYYSINAHADSHNIITAAPKSVVSQWGNGDGGADLPHIKEVIEWVYTTFADFDIRGMWVSGHSWGAMYSTNFVCSPEYADKIVGAVLESGSGMPPACTDRISVISSAAENDIGPVIDLTAIGAAHGCGAAQSAKVGNNNELFWPDCNPGFTFASYLMLGKGHADYMDAEVVKRIADLMKAARR